MGNWPSDIGVDQMHSQDLFSGGRAISAGAMIPKVNRYEHVQLIGVKGSDHALLRSAGAWPAKSGWWVSRRSPFPFETLEPFLPRYARRTVVPMVVDLIPATAWHASLANILVKSSWDSIREAEVAKTGGCTECGVKTRTECHERWSYHADLGVQRLEGFETLCGACHETRHLGFANVRGRLPMAMDRLAMINRLKVSERRPYLNLVFAMFEERSKYMWAMDLSAVSGMNVALKRALSHDGEGTISGVVDRMEVSFQLVGTRFEDRGASLVIP